MSNTGRCLLALALLAPCGCQDQPAPAPSSTPSAAIHSTTMPTTGVVKLVLAVPGVS